MLMATTNFDASRMQQTIHRMLVRQVDGVALLSSEIETGPIETLIRNRVPLVTMNRRQFGPGVSDVSVHYLIGIAEAVEHLATLRHRRIAYIGDSAGQSIPDHREHAFRKAMQKAGLKAKAEYIRVVNHRSSGSETAMMDLLQLSRPPTAVLAANDLTAIGALVVVNRQGLSVPKDISIIGFGDIELCDVFFPPLTTIRLPTHKLARMFVTALQSSAHDPDGIGKRYWVKTSLVVRNSTGSAKNKK